MSLRKQVKYNAKRCLCNNWGKTVCIVLLSTAIYLLFVIIEMTANLLLQIPSSTSSLISGVSDAWMLSFILSVVMAAGSFLLLVPLSLGITSWYYSLSDGVSEDILNIFRCFANPKMFWRSLGLKLAIGILSLLTAVLYLIVPVCGIELSIGLLTYNSFSGSIFAGSLALVFSAVLFLLMFVFLLIRLQKYFLAKYYLLDGKTSVHKAIRSSIHATKGLRDEIFVFKLSFFGWGIASVLLLPLLYFSPYYSMSSLLYARFLMEQDRRANSIIPVEAPEQNLSQTKQFESCSQTPDPTDEPTISIQTEPQD